MSRAVPEQRVFYYNFEDWLFYQNSDVSLLDPLVSLFAEESGAEPELLILDEIQNVDGWERWVRTVVDQRRYKIILTGSSTKLLSRELATFIAGRCLEHVTWPLSFHEFLDFSGSSSDGRNELLAIRFCFVIWLTSFRILFG